MCTILVTNMGDESDQSDYVILGDAVLQTLEAEFNHQSNANILKLSLQQDVSLVPGTEFY